MQHHSLKAGLLVPLLLAYSHAVTDKAKCSTVSTSLVNSDTITTEITCSEDGYRRITRKANGKEDGPWETYGPGGRLESRSTFRMGVPDGPFGIWYPDGKPYERKSYRNGRLTDTATLWYENGKMDTRIVYDTSGRKNGWSMRWDSNGILLDSIHFSGDEKKEAFYFWESGKPMFHERTVGNARTNRYDIQEASTFDSTGKRNGEVRNGDGRIIVPHTRGLGAFDTLRVKGGKPQASGKNPGYFALSLFTGNRRFSATGPNRDLISRSIVNRDTFTTEIEFDESGGGCKVVRMKNGKEDGQWEAYDSFGKPVLSSNNKNGKEDGIYEGWFDLGFPMLYEPYRNGRPIGTHKHWHGKDRLKSVRNYNTAGQMDGWSMDWAENGTLEDSVYYAKGEKREGFFFRESGKLMLHEKTRWNPRNGPHDGYYRGPYAILEGSSFDSTGKLNGEVKGGDGRLIISSACSGTDTVDVADSHVRETGYYDGHLDVNRYGPKGFSCLR